ncbi:MerR family transcriptional regulator [Streptomyces sp. 71268]|uniref:MerR family transcriptional regulator n=1 Tax=Streptomyces sp. 71268 TaxID=3002640 RepID=UPI0023F67D84|nr:MerR family transcriptional regulator [Streptomyces sp. 71268]WEV24462.1 MerR family transcriptional regulator [Streptomyces sp. 71268]
MNEELIAGELITIGELAGRTRLSPKALRLYGDRGLLSPAHVDPRTGFRRYGPDQVERARRIALLRAAGMPLARVAEVLDADAARSSRLLDAYWRERRAEHAARRAAVDHARHVLTGDGPAAYAIAERAVPEQRVVCVRRHVGAAELPGFLAEATEVLFHHLRQADACLSGPVFAAYHGLVGEDFDGLVEVCVPTRNAVEPGPRIAVRVEPAHREAYTTLARRETGYAAMAAAHDAVGAWPGARGYARGGPSREVYHPNWATAASPDEPVVDVACPFVPAPGAAGAPVDGPAGAGPAAVGGRAPGDRG